MAVVLKKIMDGVKGLFDGRFYDNGSGALMPIQHLDEDQVALLATAEAQAEILARLDDPLTAAPSTDQDPIYDHANGDKKTVLASAVVFTPPAGCKFVRMDATVDTFVRTDNAVAADDGKAIRIVGGAPAEIVPVTAGVAIRAFAAASSTLRMMPMKARA